MFHIMKTCAQLHVLFMDGVITKSELNHIVEWVYPDIPPFAVRIIKKKAKIIRGKR